MMTHDQDPDVVRWGLHHINVCALPNVGSGSTVTQYETNGSQVGYISEGYDEPLDRSSMTQQERDSFQLPYMREGYDEPLDRSSMTQHERDSFQLPYMREGYDEVAYTNANNDAAIASAFQEELSRIAADEASGMYNTGQESILQQNWSSCDGIHDTSGGEMQISCPSLSGPETSNSVDTLFGSLDILDESALDGELGKRLNDMVPIPHVPKINGELPSPDEEISDYQRLLNRLQLYNLVENKVEGDGNCQFRSLSDQLYRSSDHHKVVREQIVNQLKSHPSLYEGYVPMAYDDYLKKMSETGEWGDHVTLQAAADWFGVKIFVITSFKDTCYIEILPSLPKSKRVIFLSFWAEVHYNSIYPEGEMPLEEKKKKKWWML